MHILFSWNISRGGLLPNNFTMPRLSPSITKISYWKCIFDFRPNEHIRFWCFGKSNKNKITLVHHCSSLFCNALHMTQIKIKSNHFYCHITTAQVPWWVKFLRACSTQCKKTKNYLHIDSTYTCRLYRRQCAKNTYIYSVHTVYYKTYLVTNTHCTHSTLRTHLYIVICEGVTDYILYSMFVQQYRLVVQQIAVQRCNRLYICNVSGCALYGIQW